MSTKDYKTPNEIEIRVKAGNRAEVDRGKKKRKGSAERSKDRRRFLKRRVKKGLRFYDLGQTRSGESWVTNNYSFSPAIYLGGTFGAFRLPDFGPLELAQIQTLENQILATPLNDFREVVQSVGEAFPLLVSGEDFSFSSLDDDPFWTDNGLVLTNEQLHGPFFGIESNGGGSRLNVGVDLNNRDEVKVTAGASFGSADVPFTLSANASIYLMPEINLHFGISYTNDDPFPLIARTVVYNGIYRLRPRDFENPDKVFEYDAGGPFDEDLFNAVLSNSLPLSPTRTTSLNVYGNGDPDDITPGGTFPTGDDINEDLQFIRFDASSDHVGMLLAIVRQGGSVYYFWKLV